MTMNIYINEKPHVLTAPTTLTELIEQLGLTGKRIAIELNQEIAPRSQYSQITLQENDQLEIVHAIGGG
ncbi:thiamine biosynthesis protein ThiS [Gammaproteobacteria bacterium ESL0073]|uniref:Sulfur carrier protein ThiS n=2 Tax=Entomomonas moraniae TaxID=2213226 RepID=A0A3Q9JLU8_9GAMM|nr:thiamine biosynthesis protein ThiS [Gammaproteobacteria bacterium ESL0073]AZS50889.1 sulfur carrier protein ThiS [Entomomonas moraniae]